MKRSKVHNLSPGMVNKSDMDNELHYIFQIKQIFCFWGFHSTAIWFTVVKSVAVIQLCGAFRQIRFVTTVKHDSFFAWMHASSIFSINCNNFYRNDLVHLPIMILHVLNFWFCIICLFTKRGNCFISCYKRFLPIDATFDHHITQSYILLKRKQPETNIIW